jgi:hypothetical protein
VITGSEVNEKTPKGISHATVRDAVSKPSRKMTLVIVSEKSGKAAVLQFLMNSFAHEDNHFR